MKIAMLVNHPLFPPKTGGAKLIKHFRDALKLAHTVSLYCPADPQQELPDDELIHEMPLGVKKFFGIGRWSRLYHQTRRKEISHILFHYPWFGILLWPIRLLTGAKLRMYEHNIEYQRMRSTKKWRRWILYLYERRVYMMVDEVLFICEADRKEAIQRLGRSAERGQICPYSIDPTVYNSDGIAEARRTVREQLGIADTTSTILFFGKLDYYPNYEAIRYIIQELSPRLVKSKMDFRIIICGGNPPKEYYGVDEHIVFTGFVDDISVYIKGTDLMINPITSGGGVKTKVVETLACGKRVISTTRGAQGIEHIPADQLICQDDRDGFARSIGEYIERGEVAATDFRDYYSPEQVVARLIWNA